MKQWIGLITMILGLGCSRGQDMAVEDTPKSVVRVNVQAAGRIVQCRDSSAKDAKFAQRERCF